MNRSEILSSIAKALVGNFREVARTLRAIFDGDLLGGNQTLTASGAVTPYTTSLNVSHASVASRPRLLMRSCIAVSLPSRTPLHQERRLIPSP